MLTNKYLKIIGVFVIFLLGSSIHAATPTADLVTKYLDQSNEMYEQGDVNGAYKKINLALALAKDEDSMANVLYFAQTIYLQKLKNIQNNYNSAELIDVQVNLDKYQNLENAAIKRVIKQIESKQTEQKDLQDQQRFDKQQDSLQAQADAMREQSAALKEQTETSKQTQADLIEKLDSGFKNLGSGLEESAVAAKQSTTVIAIGIIGIALIILLIVFVIIYFIKKGLKQQQYTQEQYIKAFQAIAANQNQTNKLMLGGITDIYNSQENLKIAGASTWSGTQALPDVTFDEKDKEELQELAVKCKDLGTKIDEKTNRKNNSKNVSELVYKLSMQLGLSQEYAMLNFCAAMIYDAGFLAEPNEIIEAQTLSDEQKEKMKKHVCLAEKYLDFVPKRYWDVFNDASTKHHENMDGTGYPNGLKGEEIPQIARLIHVAETYVSMSSKRNYRQTMDKETVIEKMKQQPELYDSVVVEVLENTI